MPLRGLIALAGLVSLVAGVLLAATTIGGIVAKGGGRVSESATDAAVVVNGILALPAMLLCSWCSASLGSTRATPLPPARWGWSASLGRCWAWSCSSAPSPRSRRGWSAGCCLPAPRGGREAG